MPQKKKGHEKLWIFCRLCLPPPHLFLCLASEASASDFSLLILPPPQRLASQIILPLDSWVFFSKSQVFSSIWTQNQYSICSRIMQQLTLDTREACSLLQQSFFWYMPLASQPKIGASAASASCLRTKNLPLPRASEPKRGPNPPFMHSAGLPLDLAIAIGSTIKLDHEFYRTNSYSKRKSSRSSFFYWLYFVFIWLLYPRSMAMKQHAGSESSLKYMFSLHWYL